MPAPERAALPASSFQISLHVRHPSLDPREISRELQCEAEESFAAGEPRASRSGLAATAVHGESYWAATLDARFWAMRLLVGGSPPRAPATEGRGAAPQPVGDWWPARVAHVMSVSGALELLSVWLARRHAEFLRRIRAGGGTLTLVATALEPAQEPIRLSPELCARLADLGITLELAL